MNIRKAFFLSVFLIFGSGVIAGAQSMETVVLAGKPVMTLRYAGEYGTVMQRSIKVEQAIVQAISVENVGKPKLTTKKVGSNLHIYIGNTLLTKVYTQDAKILGTTQAALAQQWIANFKRQFPLAEPSTHMGNPNLADELSRAKAQAAKAANVRIESEEWAITQILIDEFSTYRNLTHDEAEAQKQLISVQMYRNVKQQQANNLVQKLPLAPHAPGKCPQANGCPGCKVARLAAIEGVQPVVPLIEEKPLALVEDTQKPSTPGEDSPVVKPDDNPEQATCPQATESVVTPVVLTVEPVISDTPVSNVETPAVETPAVETPAVETPAVETPAVETPAVETPAAETPAAETPAAETPAAETPAAEEEPVKTEQEYIDEAWNAVPLTAQRRITNALKLSRLCDGERWKRDQHMIVLTLVKAIRNCK